MKAIYFTLLMLLFSLTTALAQLATYDVIAGNGNGLRFWSSDSHKIHMGNSTEYHYGPVTDYSIKMNMNAITGRGWTWGQPGIIPIAAISNTGAMQIAGNFTSMADGLFNGNVGIGTTTPGKKLEVNGDILLRNSSGLKQIFTWNSSDPNWRIGMNQNPGFSRSMATSHVQFLTYAPGSTQGFAVGVNGGNSSFEIKGSDHTAFFRGNVGIGTTTPDYKLDVLGTIRANEVKVATGWSDFVFELDYALKSLDQVEKFIEENGHLPDIPSAEEVEENGISLGEMDAKLLQKIEELTLHMIRMQKQMDELKAENVLLKREIED